MEPPLTPGRERWFLVTLAAIQFSHILDFMIVMPLGPMLMKAFGIGAHEFGLLVAAYAFSAAISGLLAATFVDRFERKRLLLSVFALFSVATLACGLAPSYAILVLARSLAGAFGGLMGALVQTLIGDAIPFARRATATGIVSTAFSVSTVLGVPMSLWLANWLGWRTPFFLIAVLSFGFVAVGSRMLPQFRQHLAAAPGKHLLSATFAVMRDTNHRQALLYSALIIFSGFTVIPYITIYAIGNVGINQADVPLIYLTGGAATLFTARFIGKRADRHGKVRVYRMVATAAMVPLLAVTQLGSAPLWAWLLCTTGFFVLVSGRMIPAMAIVTSAAQPKLRGTFMSLNGTTQSLAMALATSLAGFVIHTDETGRVIGYPLAGYIALTANLLAIVFVSRIRMHDQGTADSAAKESQQA
jgi:predicted MFS family arabinose efflux permease